MSDLRTAAQQALEFVTSEVWGTTPYMDVRVYEDASKLRDAIRAALAEPVQEPVAKVELMTTGGNAGLATRIVEIDDHLRERLRPGQLLYTTPPQRLPLTEEEIEMAYRKIWRDLPTDFDHTSSGWIEQGIRYAERAHGIGEAK